MQFSMQHLSLDDARARDEIAAASQKCLTALARRRLAPAQPTGNFDAELEAEIDARRLEERFVTEERRRIAEWAAEAPHEPDAFIAWFRKLRSNGPGQADPLFLWLEHDASLDEMKWFLRQEMAGEAGFDDLVALTQLKLPARAKLELARNYWDEMGQGTASGMHGRMLARLGTELGIEPNGDTVWESLALANLMTALAGNRRYAYHALGALGVIELTAPGRSARVNAGLKRLGVGGAARQYFALHATLDVRHADAWCQEVFAPLVAADGAVATAMAEGALMRLHAGARCFERYRRELGLGDK